MPPSRDDFARWRDDHVTRWVMEAHHAAAEANKAEWIKSSWETGRASEGALRLLRANADAYEAISRTDYEGFCDMLGEQPRDE